MGRPRMYSSTAEKQSAYRQRLAAETLLVDRKAQERLHRDLEKLREAVWRAAERGDGFAKRCVGGSTQTVVHKLIMAFEQQCVAGADLQETSGEGMVETGATGTASRGGKQPKKQQEKQGKASN